MKILSAKPVPHSISVSQNQDFPNQFDITMELELRIDALDGATAPDLGNPSDPGYEERFDDWWMEQETDAQNQFKRQVKDLSRQFEGSFEWIDIAGGEFSPLHFTETPVDVQGMQDIGATTELVSSLWLDQDKLSQKAVKALKP